MSMSLTAGEERAMRHGMNCPATTPGNEDACTCGLKWRDALATEQTMHAAWRKRAEEAETKLREFRWTAGPADDGNEPGEVEVGDKFLILVCVCDRLNGSRAAWEPDVITATEDGWDADGESWSAWDWSDVSYWMAIGRHNLPPLPESEAPRFVR